MQQNSKSNILIKIDPLLHEENGIGGMMRWQSIYWILSIHIKQAWPAQ